MMRDKNRNADMIIYVLLAALMTIVWYFASGTAYNRGEAKLPVNFNLLLYVGAILGVSVRRALYPGSLILYSFLRSFLRHASYYS